MDTIDITEKFLSEKWNKTAKYNDYVVCLCAKNENEYLQEWIMHYISIGFHKIVIADNNNDDSLDNLLKEYIDKEIIYIVNFRNTHLEQKEFFETFANNKNFKWAAFFDTDEFLEIYYPHIAILLENLNEDVVCFNWMMFDSNGEISKRNGYVQTRFPEPVYPISITKENMFIKSILRGGINKKIKFNGSHIPYCEEYPLTYNVGGTVFNGLDKQNMYPLRYKNGYLKHYYTKSAEEWNIKYDRGWPGHGNMNYDDFNVMSSVNIPTTNYSLALFCDNNDKIMPKEIFDRFNVIKLEYHNSPYAFIRGINVLMEQCKNHIFIITDNIDDTLFALCLETAFKTNNILVSCAPNDYAINSILFKYNHGRNDNYMSIGLF